MAPAARTSLLQPGRRPHALDPADGFLLLMLGLVSFALRWDLRGAQPYIAETWHFVVAAKLWASTFPSLVPADGGAPFDLSWFFWQRPLLTLPFHPFAKHSFAAYRAAHVAVAALVPVLGAALLRTLGTGRLAAALAGFVLAVHPILLPWGVFVLPDSLVLALLLGALLAAHHGRPAVTAGLLWAATWVKEVAFVTAVVLLALACWRDADGRRAGLRPVRLGPFARWLLPVVPLAFLPLLVSMQVPGALFPGFRAGGELAETLERLFLLLWLAPVALLGLARPATRRLTLVALAWPAFFLLYHLSLDKAMEAWYYVLPASFTVLAAAAGLDGLAKAAPGSRAARPRRGVAGVAAALVLALVWVQVAVPDGDARNQQLVTPLTGRGQWDLEQVQAFERVRDAGLARLIAVPGPDERGHWIAYDVEVSFLFYPLADQAMRIHTVGSTPAPLDEATMLGWQWAIENATDATLVVANDAPGNVATRLAYAECSLTDGPFVLIRARSCQGAGDDLWAQYARLVPAPS